MHALRHWRGNTRALPEFLDFGCIYLLITLTTSADKNGVPPKYSAQHLIALWSINYLKQWSLTCTSKAGYGG